MRIQKQVVAAALAGCLLAASVPVSGASSVISGTKSVVSDSSLQSVTAMVSGSASPGSLIAFTGSAPYAEVAAKLLRPDGTILYFGIAAVNSAGEYELAIRIPADAQLGSYMLVVGSGSDVVTVPVVVAAGSSGTDGGITPPPTVPPGEQEEQEQEEQEQEQEEANQLVLFERGEAVIASEVVEVKAVREAGRMITMATVEGSSLLHAFQERHARGAEWSGNRLTIAASGNLVRFSLPMDALAVAYADDPSAVLGLQTEAGRYSLPLALLSKAVLAGDSGTYGIAADGWGQGKLIVELEHSPNSASTAIAHLTVRAALQTDQASYPIASFGRAFTKKEIFLHTVESSALESATVVQSGLQAPGNYVPHDFRLLDSGPVAVIHSVGHGTYAVVAAPTVVFTDMAGHWAQTEVTEVAGKFIVQGVSPERFAPQQSITRAQLITLLVRSLGLEPDQPSAFPDVPDSAWYAGYVGVGSAAGIIAGYPDGSFRPDVAITRQELAAIISRSLEVAGASVVGLSQSEVERQLGGYRDEGAIGAWARPAMAALNASGALKGRADGVLAPTGLASRAEAAVMLPRILKLIIASIE